MTPNETQIFNMMTEDLKAEIQKLIQEALNKKAEEENRELRETSDYKDLVNQLIKYGENGGIEILAFDPWSNPVIDKHILNLVKRGHPKGQNLGNEFTEIIQLLKKERDI